MESRLVGGQQAAAVLLQHEVLHMVFLQQQEKNVRAQPIVGGHIFSRLANIDVLTFGSWRAAKFKR